MKLKICPLSVAVFLGTAYCMTMVVRQNKKKRERGDDDNESGSSDLPTCHVVFVLGGPGAGKGTQCELLVDRLESGWAHLSTGDLLRSERKKGGELGDQINTIIEAGKLVPSEITCKLLEKGMTDVYKSTGKTKFLIDGFPRSFGNASAWESTMQKHRVEFVLNFDCPEEVMLERLKERSKTSGRNDDSEEVIRKRFKTHENECAPVIEHYKNQDGGGMLKTVRADRSVEDVYKEVEKLFVDL